jgi:outer membrane protein, heavy metal efflux system
MSSVVSTALLFLLVAAAPAEASLQDLLQRAYDNNGAIQAARAGAEAAGARVGHAGALPGPQLRATAFVVPIETRVGPQWFSLSLSQRFPWFGKLNSKKRIAGHARSVAAVRADAKIRDVLVEVKLAWFELHYLTRALEIVRENTEIARHVVEFGTAAYGRQEVPFYDVHRARAEMARLSYDEAKLLDLSLAQEARLLALVGEEDGGALPAPAPLPFLEMRLPLDELTALALAHRLELDAAEAAVDGAEEGIHLARKDYWPDLVVGLSWMAQEEKGPAPDAGKDAFGVIVGFDLPVWAWRVDDRIDEATARAREARETLRDRRAWTRAQVVERYVSLVDAARLLRLYRGTLLPQARAALESAEEESRGGRTLAALLERKALWLRYRLAEQRALADYYKAVARLEQIVSIPLPLTAPQEVTP